MDEDHDCKLSPDHPWCSEDCPNITDIDPDDIWGDEYRAEQEAEFNNLVETGEK